MYERFSDYSTKTSTHFKWVICTDFKSKKKFNKYLSVTICCTVVRASKIYYLSSFLSKFQNNLQRLHNNLLRCVMMLLIQADVLDERTDRQTNDDPSVGRWCMATMFKYLMIARKYLFIDRMYRFTHNHYGIVWCGVVVPLEYFHFDHCVLVLYGMVCVCTALRWGVR